ncbi:MAG: choice-of-anchor D domain-containing protein [Bacteroides sp.]|jgi:hypothetical protein|nr:choice-of-anchor D domain-containing protein [Bacteroides sp.]
MKKKILLFTGSLFMAFISMAMTQLEFPFIQNEDIQGGEKQIVHENFNDPVFPPSGYLNQALVGLAVWENKLEGVLPTAFPEDGNFLISYNTLYDGVSGSSAALITPLITIPSSGYRVRFSMYRDGSFPDASDRIEVLVNSKAMINGATSLGVVHRSIALSPVVPTEGWFYFDFPIPLTGDIYLIFKAISGFGANLHMDAFFVEQITPGLPSLGVIPPAIDFGSVPVGYDGESRNIRLWNVGEGNLIINQGDIVLSETGAGAYTLSEISYPIELGNYESFDIGLGFLPASAGAHNAQLQIAHNGENTPTAVNISGEGYEPLEYFFEQFDGVVAPFLPPTWRKIIQSSVDNAFVGTYTLADPNSLPNHLRMDNAADAAAQLMLVSPAVSGFDVNWLGFSVKTFSLNQLLKIGTLSDPRNPETFEEIERIIIPAYTYNRFYLSLQEYTGSNKYIAFMHGLGGSNRSIYLDDVLWEPMPPDPMFSVLPSSKDYGDIMVGASALQTFTLTNTSGGILTIHPENIVLGGDDPGDFILSSLTETINLSFGQTATFSVSFVPQSPGDKTSIILIEDNLSGKVLHQVPLSGRAYSGMVTEFPWTETFEDHSLSRPAWTQVKVAGNASWTYSTGSSGGLITTAYEGSKNARFVSVAGSSSPITRLITPLLDLTGMAAPSLVFFMGQQDWSGDQNETKVFYRTSEINPWVQLAHYTENISSWTQEMLALPEPSASYQLAFEGINNYGRANVLDLVSVCPELLPVSVSITASQTEVCQGTSVTLTATPVNGGSSPVYQWKKNGANVGTGGPTYAYTPANGDQVWVVMTSSETCTTGNPATSNTIGIIVNENPVVSWNWQPAPLYPWDNPITLSGGLPSGGQYTGPGVSSGVFYPLVAGPGIHTLIYTYSSTSGCQGSAQVMIEVLEAPDCSSPTNLAAFDITFNSALLSWTSGGNETQWLLEWGLSGFSPGIGSGNQVTISTNPEYSLSGLLASTDYEFYVRAICAGGITSGWAGPYEFTTQPSQEEVSCPGNMSVCISESIFTLTGATPAGGVYEGSGVSADLFDPSVAGVGSHLITYTFQGSVCQFTIIVQPALPVSVTISTTQTEVCQGSAATFTASPVNGGNSPQYQWKVNGNNVGSNSPSFAYTPANNDQVWVVMTSSAGCTSGNPATSNAITMTVSPPLPVSVSINASQTEVCQGTVVTFSSSVVNGGSSPVYQWKVNGNNAGSNSSSLAFTPVNGDQVSLVLTSSASCVSGNPATSNTIEMVVHPSIPVSINVVSDYTEVCEGTTAYFIALQTNGGTQPAYQWKVNNESMGTNSPVFSYVPDDGDQVWAVLTSNVQCAVNNPATSNTLEVTVLPKPEVSWVWEYESVCIQVESLPLSGGTPEGGLYSGPGVSGALFYPQQAGPGWHTLSYTITDDQGCSNSALADIFVDACTGISEGLENSDFTIYPNPARNQINVRLEKDAILLQRIVVLDIQGNFVLEIEKPEARRVYTLDIRSLPKGVYFIHFLGEKGLLRGKFVVM